MAAPYLFLLFFCSIITLSLASVNIDCGTSLSTVDDNNIKWVGDKDFITSGESATISSTTVEKSLTTLRYFPTGDSNCYSNIPVTKGGKVLVRTMFYYGNYDGKFLSPSFSIVFEGKHQRSMSILSAFETYFLELIFSPAGGETSVCFVRTSTSSNPFVSSIEVVDLDDGMYNELGPGEGLFYQQRRAYGATQVLRSDSYGRFWLPAEQNVLLTGIQSTAAFIDTSGASNKPPESVLRTSWALEGLPLVDYTLPFVGVPVYLVMYFSEPFQSGVRSFNILFGGKQINRVPVMPVYGKTMQLVVRDVVASSSTLLEFHSTSISATLPPMINAGELYVISKGMSGGGGGSGSNGSGGGGGFGSGGSGSNGSGGGGGGFGSGGSGSGGSGGTSNGGSGANPGGSSNGKSSELLTIIGVVIAAAVSLVAVVCIAICLVKRCKTKPITTGTGSSQPPMNGQQMNNDSNQPTNEVDMEVDINELIEVNQSYVVRSH